MSEVFGESIAIGDNAIHVDQMASFDNHIWTTVRIGPDIVTVSMDTVQSELDEHGDENDSEGHGSNSPKGAP
jgi:hypothetical protein